MKQAGKKSEERFSFLLWKRDNNAFETTRLIVFKQQLFSNESNAIQTNCTRDTQSYQSVFVSSTLSIHKQFEHTTFRVLQFD